MNSNFAKQIEKQIRKAALQGMENLVRERIGTIRHPETGEFPTVVILGDDLENLKASIEGSPELLAIVKKRMAEDDAYADIRSLVMTDNNIPKVFLSYASEDKILAEKIAQQLQANGIDTWWDEWCINSGDSLRQKIDEGLKDCTDFVVLLTPSSIEKPWVNQEMDAGLVKKLKAQCRFIALRHNLSADMLPPLLSGNKSPEIKDPDKDIAALINDIHGISKKPPLGSAPAIVQEAKSKETGYSPAATAVAKVFVEQSKNAVFGDPQLSYEKLQNLTGLTEDDVEDALHELTGMIKVSFKRALPKDELYAKFDKYWKDWDPADDALRLATDLNNDENFPSATAQIAERYGWEPRRINPAISYLINRKIIRDSKVLGSQPWITAWVQKTDETRRFVKSRL